MDTGLGRDSSSGFVDGGAEAVGVEEVDAAGLVVAIDVVGNAGVVAAGELVTEDAAGIEEVVGEAGIVEPPVSAGVLEEVHDESASRAPAPDAARPKSASC